MKTSLRFALLLSLSIVAFAQKAATDPWNDWQFLLGEWTSGQSSGVPGQASKGSFTLAPDLGGQVLVRKNHAEYPPAGGRPAIVHDEVMIIYQVPSGT